MYCLVTLPSLNQGEFLYKSGFPFSNGRHWPLEQIWTIDAAAQIIYPEVVISADIRLNIIVHVESTDFIVYDSFP